jgi:hypothetical protein
MGFLAHMVGIALLPHLEQTVADVRCRGTLVGSPCADVCIWYCGFLTF